MKRTVLVVNAGDGPGLNFIRSLRKVKTWHIVSVDIDLQEYHGSEADERYFLEWTDEDRLVEYINEIIDRHHADLLYVADTDREILVVSRRRDEFHAPLFLPDYQDHMRMEDKWLTWQTLHKAGIAVPDTRLVKDEATLARMLKKYDKVWLRRISGAAGAGSMSTDSLAFAKAWLDYGDGWGDFTVAECLTPRMATFSGLWYKGELVASQLRDRLSWRYPWLSVSGVTGITGAQRTIWDEDLHKLAVDSIRAACKVPHGAIGIDFVYDEAGKPYITEVQPARFYSSMQFLTEAGLNLPDWYCRLALDGRGSEKPQINPIREPLIWTKGVDQLPKLLRQEEYFIGPDH